MPVVSVALRFTTAAHAPVSLLTVTSVGQEITGATPLTVIVNVQAAVKPESSVAVNCMIFTPTENVEPEAIPEVTETVELQLSKVVASLNVTTAPESEVAVSVILSGQSIVGGVLSITVTIKVHASLLTVFVAVAVTEVVPTGKFDPRFGLYVIVEVGIPVVSVAVKFISASQASVSLLTVTSLGQEITGATPSTVIVKVQTSVKLEASVAVKSIVFVPTGNVEPEAIPEVLDTVALQLSVAVASINVTTAPDVDVAVTVMSLGQVIVGAVLSLTVTLHIAVFVLLLPSVAVSTTICVPVSVQTKVVSGEVSVGVTQLSILLPPAKASALKIASPSESRNIVGAVVGQFATGTSLSIPAIKDIAIPVKQEISLASLISIVCKPGVTLVNTPPLETQAPKSILYSKSAAPLAHEAQVPVTVTLPLSPGQTSSTTLILVIAKSQTISLSAGTEPEIISLKLKVLLDFADKEKEMREIIATVDPAVRVLYK